MDTHEPARLSSTPMTRRGITVLTKERLDEIDRQQRESAVRVATARLASQIGSRFTRERASLSAYKVVHKGQEAILERLKGIVARLAETVTHGESIVLFGAPGTGKDHLMAALLYELIQARPTSTIQWTTGLDFYDTTRRYMRGDDRPTSLKLAVSADVWAISDTLPPADEPTPAALNQLHRIVDARYSRMRPTWMTVNFRDEAEARAKLTVQLFDRLRDGGHLIPCFWPSWRTPK